MDYVFVSITFNWFEKKVIGCCVNLVTVLHHWFCFKIIHLFFIGFYNSAQKFYFNSRKALLLTAHKQKPKSNRIMPTLFVPSLICQTLAVTLLRITFIFTNRTFCISVHVSVRCFYKTIFTMWIIALKFNWFYI
jgi:hypothetical protein